MTLIFKNYKNDKFIGHYINSPSENLFLENNQKAKKKKISSVDENN
jgi:hypothetical protein